jgi:hypothetical protein
MLRKAILLCAVSMLLVTPGQARFKKPGSNTVSCGCTCILDNGIQKEGTYDPKGPSCRVLEKKTCNVEIPGTSLVASGTLNYCVQKDVVGTSGIKSGDSKPRRPKGVPSDAVVAPLR